MLYVRWIIPVETIERIQVFIFDFEDTKKTREALSQLVRIPLGEPMHGTCIAQSQPQSPVDDSNSLGKAILGARLARNMFKLQVTYMTVFVEDEICPSWLRHVGRNIWS
jgi:hypothetical protein